MVLPARVEVFYFCVFKPRAPPERQLAKAANLSHHVGVVMDVDSI